MRRRVHPERRDGRLAVQPGAPNRFGLVQGEANAVAPGKRMLSAAPTIVTDTSGNLDMLVGGRGGPRIITAVVQVIVDVGDGFGGLVRTAKTPRAVYWEAWGSEFGD